MFSNPTKPYCGEYTCESVLEKIEALESKMEKEIEKVYTEAKEKLQSVRKNYEIEITSFRISLEREKEFHKELLKQEETVKKLAKEAELNKEKEQVVMAQQLETFLMEKTKYKKGNSVFFENVNKEFNNWLGKNVSNIDNKVFRKVNPGYNIEICKVCKDCKKESQKGCCEKYSNTNRTTKKIIRNIELNA